MSRRSGTDGSLLSSLPWSLFALAVALSPHLPYLPVWITFAFFFCAGGRWLVEIRRWRLPPAWLRVVLSLAAFVGVLASYESVSGVGPGSALLAVMAALKLMETRQRRDQFVLLFIAVFLIMASLLREQFLWSLPYLFIALLVTMTAWLQMSAREAVSIKQSLATCGRLMAYSLPLMLAMWLFFPRIATPFWAVPVDTSSASSGISDTMNPGDISSLSLSDAVAFRVQFEGAVPQPRDRYWRGVVLHRFNGRSWAGIEPTPDWNARDRIEFSGLPVNYTVTLEPTRQHWVFALDIPYDVSLERTFMGPQQQLMRARPLDQRVVYEAQSYTNYRIDADLGRTPRSWYSRLPNEGNRRSRELAQQLRAAAASDEAFITSVLQRFNEEDFYYTLQPPRLGANAVDEFLFETQRGFCEHYASAFAVLMRSVGIPARVVLGYQGGELNPLGNYLIVRQSDAHAWNEVWLEGRGWVRVDPTAAVAPERIESGMSGAMIDGIGASWGLTAPARWLHNLTLTWDALNAQWNEWVLGYGPENQNRFLNWLGMEEPNWRKLMLTMLGTVMAMVALLSLWLFWRYRPPRRDSAARLYQRFVKKLGEEPRRGESPLAFATRVGQQDRTQAATINTVTQHYLEARYGPSDDAALHAFKRAVDTWQPRA